MFSHVCKKKIRKFKVENVRLNWKPQLPNMSIPSFAYSGLKKPSTNWINHHVMKNVTATGNRTTLQKKREEEQCMIFYFFFGNMLNLVPVKDVPSSHKFSWHPTLKNSAACLHKTHQTKNEINTWNFKKCIKLIPIEHNCFCKFMTKMQTTLRD